MKGIELKARELLAAQYQRDGWDTEAGACLRGASDACDRFALRAIASALTPKWMPIDSAPKDGSDIHLFSERGQAVGYWDEDEDSFVTDYRGKGNFDFVAATHWQPLPAPPEVEG